MRPFDDNSIHLGYCTNVHQASGWFEVFASLQRHAPELGRRLAGAEPFGLGLRLSDAEARALFEADRLARFEEFLARHNLYVFTINGFVYGTFHNTPVKENVHAPDWRTQARVDYTLRLVHILARLLPEGVEGSISTNPLSYSGWIEDEPRKVFEASTANLVGVVEALVELYERTGTLIHLDIEPEPDGLLETCEQTAAFFERWVFDRGSSLLAERLETTPDKAVEHLARHLRVCLDACHLAVSFEDPAGAISRLARAGAKIGKLQISSAIAVDLDPDPDRRQAVADRLSAFDEPTYLHQVVQKNRDGSLEHFADLDRALERIEDPQAHQWRVHFHVPVFCERFEELASTQPSLRQTLSLFEQQRWTQHLEVETYTWSVLPPGIQQPLVDSIEREIRWVIDATT